jgi:hypothetical protein
MFGAEAQTELEDLKVVAINSGGEMKYIARTGEGSRPRQIGDLARLAIGTNPATTAYRV